MAGNLSIAAAGAGRSSQVRNIPRKYFKQKRLKIHGIFLFTCLGQKLGISRQTPFVCSSGSIQCFINH